MSHLSLAFIGLGAGSLAAGMTHLVNHAIFKALLFLSAGAVILLTQHTKSLWPLGGLGKKLTLIALFMGMGVLSLGGVPPFSGFFSKDAIITATLTNPETFGLISTLTLVAGLLSIAYGGRLWVLIFSGKPRDKELYEKVEKPSLFWITLPLGIMALLTLGLGFFQNQLALFITGKPFSELHLSWLFPLMMSIITLFALLIYFFYYARVDLRDKVAAQPLMKTIHQILFNGYYVEAMISWLTNNFVLGGVAKTVGWIEKNIIDAVINSTVKMSHTLFKIFGHTHSAKVSNQTGGIIAGLVFVLGVILFRSILL
jgi:NADH-quinone oxidoreductase subunit L